MRSVFFVLLVFSTATAATSEPIETITRDVSIAASAPVESVHSLTGAIFLRRNSRVSGNVETGNGEIVVEPGSEVTGKLSNTTGTIRIDGARVGGRVSTTYGDIYMQRLDRWKGPYP